MAANYEEAVEALYRAPHEAFVAERKKLAAALKAAGDKPGAARLLALGRPTLSAWVVNQLFWQAREPFEGLFAAASRLRAGDAAATGERRDAMAALKSRAAALLVGAGHAVNEATLRRVTTTLAALAAAGGFDPDPPGALRADRDPPGFDVAGLGVLAASAGAGLPAERETTSRAPAAVSPSPAPAKPASAKPASAKPASAKPASAKPAPAKPTPPPPAADVPPPEAASKRREQAEREQAQREQAQREQAQREQAQREQAEREQAERLRAEREKRRQEVERAERRAELQRLEASLATLQNDHERRQREVERLRAELQRVEGLTEQARSALEAAAKRLAELRERD